MSQRDSLGFSLPALTDAEQRARAAALAAEQSPARVKEWAAAAPLTRTVATAPASADVPKKLKALARAGIPQLLRPTLWLQLSGGQALRAARPADHYAKLCAAADGGASPKASAGRARAPRGRGARASCDAELAESRADSVVVSRLELEGFNAFPSHALLSSIKGLSAVRRVVLAHATHVGAASLSGGIVSVAAFLLAAMGPAKEEEAFWTLCALRELRLHPSHYENMRGCRVETLTLNDLVARKCPRTAALFQRASCALSDVTSEWMEYLFVRSLPPETAARVLDVLLLEGPKTLQRVGVALFKVAEPGLLQSCKGLQVAQVLRWRIARAYAADAVLRGAYPAIPGGVISAAAIEQLRAGHQMAVAGEKVDIVRRLTTMAALPTSPTRVPTISWGGGTGGAAGGAPSRSSSAASVAVAASGRASPPPYGEVVEALSEEELHAEAERALSEGGSPREQLQMASLSMLLTQPNVVLQAARSL
eukprot:scaffold14.g1308.t1